MDMPHTNGSVVMENIVNARPIVPSRKASVVPRRSPGSEKLTAKRLPSGMLKK